MKVKSMSIRLDKNIDKRLRTYAKKSNLTMTKIIELALNDYLRYKLTLKEIEQYNADED